MRGGTGRVPDGAARFMIRRMARQRSVIGSAKLIALCTLLSRVLGLAREMLFAYAFGTGWVPDRFFYAFQVPNLFRRLLGEGAMAAVFVPTFSQKLEREGRESAWRLLGRTLALLTVALTLLLVAVELILLLVWAFVPVEPAALEGRELLLGLTALMMPFMVTVCVLALFSAILNCLGAFVLPALMPVLLNVCMIVALAWVAPALYPASEPGRAYVVACSVLAAGVLQLAVMLPVLRAHGVRLGWRFQPRDPDVRRMVRLLGPVALGQGVLAFGVFLDAQICILLSHRAGAAAAFDVFGWTLAYPLEDGALSALTYAQRLYQFPLGVLVVSLATAAMPALSRLAAREDWHGWAAEARQSLRLAVFEGILAGAMMLVVAEPIVRLLFERGDFGAADTDRTAAVVRFYGLAMCAYCAQHLVLRAFFSLGDVRTPLKISAAVLPLNVGLTLVLVWVDALRESAFALSSAVTSSVAVLTGLWILGRKTQQSFLEPGVMSAVARMLVAGGGAAVAALAFRAYTPEGAALLSHGLLARGYDALMPLALGTAVFLAVGFVLRLPEVGLVLVHRGRTQSEKHD